MDEAKGLFLHVAGVAEPFQLLLKYPHFGFHNRHHQHSQ
jgi:hypothetical protein